ncbi:MAG TPA: PilZ domain-containing protein [Gemmatimonadales bacterium]|nr:PilZ domain-containing protein [Gemmatimonadales bacterium]
MIDRRFDIRIPRADALMLSWTDQAGQKHQNPAHLVDVSASGASIRLQHPIRVGTTLSFGFDDKEFSGRVTHCVAQNLGYTLGVEFLAGYRWSPRLD